MGDTNKPEEKTVARQSFVLIVGLALLFCWHWLSYPTPVSEPLAPTTYSADTLSISAITLAAPVVYATSGDEPNIQIFLRSGATHLYNTAEPGEVGNCYIVGHSSDYENTPGDYKNVFARLPELKIGDEIQILTSEETFFYTVKYMRVVEPDNLSVLSQDTDGRKLLTLQTSYPIGTAKQRFLVVAEQMEK